MSAVEPTVWSAKEFRSASSPLNPFKRHRGEQLQIIDQALEEFDRLRRTNLVATKLACARQIMEGCKRWTVDKAGKQSENAQLRRAAVEALGQQCFEFVQYHAFQGRKQRAPDGAPNLRGMRPGYDRERAMYVAAGKQQMPVSGSYIHAVMESREGGQFRGRSFAQLTESDFRALDTAYNGEVPMVDPMGDPGSMAKTQQPRTVLFLAKQERIKRLLIFKGNPPLVWDGWDSKFETGGRSRAYVIDEYGNMYSSNEIFDRRYSFNHSTFNAGKDVICAGTVSAADGQLTWINNSSGHYKPTRQNLHDAVRLLDDAGIDLARLKVTVGEPDPMRVGKMVEHDYDDARVFLANMNAAPTRSVAEP